VKNVAINLSPQNFEYGGRVSTRQIVDYLMKRSDQVAMTHKIGEALGDYSPLYRQTRAALERLRKVNRVAEIFRDMWHLE
jgi:hypothetical protein